MSKNCEKFQKIEEEFNDKIEEFQRNYVKVKEKGNINLEDGKDFFTEIEVLKDEIMEKMSENRQLRFFDSSYSVYKEIEQVLFEEGFSQLIEMEMLKDGTIIAKTEMLNNSLVENSLIKINLDNEISFILNNAGDKLGKLCLGDESIFIIGDCDIDGKYSQNFYEINLETNKIQKIQDFQGRAFTFEDEVFVKNDTFFAVVALEGKQEEEEKSGILCKKLGEKAVFLSSEDEYVHFADMSLDKNTNILSGIAFGEHDHEKIFDIKEDESGEYYLDYRHEELHNETNNYMLNNGTLLKEEFENGSDFVNFYIDKTCSDGENKKVLTVENTNFVEVFRLKGGVFAVEKQYSIQNKSVSEIYLVKENGNVEVIKEIDGRKLAEIEFLKIQADGTLSGKEKSGGTFMFDGEKYVFLNDK